jgi:hypothetical protein
MLENLTECGAKVDLECKNGFGEPGYLRGWDALLTIGLEKAANSL